MMVNSNMIAFMDKAIDKYWYPTSQPWFSGKDVGTGILAGSEDPHAAMWVADMADMHEHLQDHQSMLETEAHDHVTELVAHIIETHNTWLDAKKDAFGSKPGISVSLNRCNSSSFTIYFVA